MWRLFPDSFAPDSSLRASTLEAMGKEYDAGETEPAPRRITCFFVDRDHRRSGVALEALDGAFVLIAQAGGGEVVSFAKELAPGKRTSSSFLHNGTRAMFEKAGFTFERHIDKSKTVMRKTFPAFRGGRRVRTARQSVQLVISLCSSRGPSRCPCAAVMARAVHHCAPGPIHRVSDGSATGVSQQIRGAERGSKDQPKGWPGFSEFGRKTSELEQLDHHADRNGCGCNQRLGPRRNQNGHENVDQNRVQTITGRAGPRRVAERTNAQPEHNAHQPGDAQQGPSDS